MRGVCVDYGSSIMALFFGHASFRFLLRGLVIVLPAWPRQNQDRYKQPKEHQFSFKQHALYLPPLLGLLSPVSCMSMRIERTPTLRRLRLCQPTAAPYNRTFDFSPLFSGSNMSEKEGFLSGDFRSFDCFLFHFFSPFVLGLLMRFGAI
jgi:hypothetical protein